MYPTSGRLFRGFMPRDSPTRPFIWLLKYCKMNRYRLDNIRRLPAGRFSAFEPRYCQVTRNEFMNQKQWRIYDRSESRVVVKKYERFAEVGLATTLTKVCINGFRNLPYCKSLIAGTDDLLLCLRKETRRPCLQHKVAEIIRLDYLDRSYRIS